VALVERRTGHAEALAGVALVVVVGVALVGVGDRRAVVAGVGHRVVVAVRNAGAAAQGVAGVAAPDATGARGARGRPVGDDARDAASAAVGGRVQVDLAAVERVIVAVGEARGARAGAADARHVAQATAGQGVVDGRPHGQARVRAAVAVDRDPIASMAGMTVDAGVRGHA